VTVVCCLLGLIWAVVNIHFIEKINVRTGFIDDNVRSHGVITKEQEDMLLDLGHKISEVFIYRSRVLKSFSNRSI
jgi:hypothetical protein